MKLNRQTLKKILILLPLTLSGFCNGQTVDLSQYFVSASTRVGNYFVAPTDSCAIIYYYPLKFKLDPARTLALENDTTENSGNQILIHPRISVSLSLVPVQTIPDSIETAEIQAAATILSPNCQSAAKTLQLYPISNLVANPDFKHFPAILKGLSIDTVSFELDGNLNFQITIDPVKASLEKVSAFLGMDFAQVLSFAIHRDQPLIDIELDLHTDAEAVFRAVHWTETVCHIQQQCVSAFGVNIYCWNSNHCDNLDRSQNVLDSLSENRIWSIRILHMDRVATLADLSRAQDELVSKFMVSDYQHTVETQRNNITTVSVDLQRSMKAEKALRFQLPGVEFEYFDASIGIDSSIQSLNAEIALLFKNPRLRCMQTEARTGQKITTSDACQSIH